MSTYTQILYQIVFSTYRRTPSLKAEGREDLYRYISGILENKKCHLYQIGGIDNHIHIITHLHPAISLSSLVKDIKLATTEYIRKEKLFRDFEGWQDGYGAFTYDISARDNLIKYVRNQEMHHRKVSAREELMVLLEEQGVGFDEKYML
ncbi:MAG: IS200/IS605 family transposase [Bacteroidales bacterium]|nr:IS200/IS605 family transposase [Bacteroidales bacterium]